ncbi:MAG TPA: hypothetical protein PLQ41_01450 [bacterium]|nr:hypothetical protein [bacterium]HPP29674.1 hypothetical protein [bacterium]
MGKRLLFLILYAVAMAYVEAMVVVYLRWLIPVSQWPHFSTYKEFWSFIRNAGIMWSEQTREFATIVMLVCIAFLFGKNKRERIAGFLIAFGIWDIFYYVFLYLWLRWPENILVWDVLFLIPCPWVSPVIIPVSVSILMIGTGYYLLQKRHIIYPVQR